MVEKKWKIITDSYRCDNNRQDYCYCHLFEDVPKCTAEKCPLRLEEVEKWSHEQDNDEIRIYDHYRKKRKNLKKETGK